MANYYCKFCGFKTSSVSALTSYHCTQNPEGKHHALYEGSEKSQYVCKYCGSKASSLSALTGFHCMKNPNGKHHCPAI